MAKGMRKKTAAPEEMDRLFELPSEQFTSARDQLAKRLTAEGHSDEARAVKALRRPTVAAWAVNQLVRRRPREIDKLQESGAALRRAQRKVLSGVRTADFREASESRRRLVNRLARTAEDILRESGHASAGAGESVRSTLEAASLDEDSGDLVRAGRLSKELPPPASFGAVVGLGLVPSPREEAPAPPKPRRRGESETREEEAKALRAQREQADKEARALEDKAAHARRTAVKARQDAERAEGRANRLREEAEDARVKAREMSKKSQQADTEATRAQEAATRANRRAEGLLTTTTRRAPSRRGRAPNPRSGA